MKFRIWKSLTFLIGLILFIAAFGVILVAGSIFNPPPYDVVIALEDVSPYTRLTRDMVAVDQQTMSQKVASRLVHEGEVDRYLGGLVVETIHAGEPLRRNALVAADNPAAVHRLSLALTDPNLVAAVVPVTPKIIPGNVTPGDYVNVTMGIKGNVSQVGAATWGEQQGGAAGWGGGAAPVEPTATPPLTASLPYTSAEGLPPGEEVPTVQPPLAKLVLPQVEVIDVKRKKVANPNYGMSSGGMGGGDGGEVQQQAFLEGDVESVTLLVPRSAEELLYFAVDNGTLHMSVVPHAAVVEGESPSTGVLWKDFERYFQRERLRSLGIITASTTVTSVGTPSPTISATPPVTVTPPSLPTATPAGSAKATSAPTPAPTQPPKEGGLLGGGLSGLLVPACLGGGLILGLAAIGIMLMRRSKG